MSLKHILSKEAMGQLKEEVEVLCQLDHPNIVRLEEVSMWNSEANDSTHTAKCRNAHARH